MTDVIDQGCEREEKDRAIAIEVQRRSVKEMPATGYCYNCDEPLLDGTRFCDGDCRDDWQKRNKK